MAVILRKEVCAPTIQEVSTVWGGLYKQGESGQLNYLLSMFTLENTLIRLIDLSLY